jgi:hypothetical protein
MTRQNYTTAQRNSAKPLSNFETEGNIEIICTSPEAISIMPEFAPKMEVYT